jgi:hypothetical protein
LLPSERDVVVGVHRAGGMGRSMAGVCVMRVCVCVKPFALNQKYRWSCSRTDL